MGFAFRRGWETAAPRALHNCSTHVPCSHPCSVRSADATAFVVTYPVDSSPAKRAAALAWEAAFLTLARGELSDVAAAGGLRLSFSTERSVQDELEREVRAARCCFAAAGLGSVLGAVRT